METCFSIFSWTNPWFEFSPDPAHEVGCWSRDLLVSFPASYSVTLWFFTDKIKKPDTIGPVLNISHKPMALKSCNTTECEKHRVLSYKQLSW